MEIVFLGTASNNPSPCRNVSCTALRLEGDIWLFDVGEATQIQLMKTTLKAGKISKIFITHLHGDHVFGLPGLLCTISQNRVDNKQIELYGPVGLRRFVRTTLELSGSMLTYNYVVHELEPLSEQIPDEIKAWKISPNDDSILHPSESLGRTIQIDADGCWKLLENNQVIVKASWIKHRMPTFGFVIEQKPTPGRLDVDGLKQRGITPGPLYAKIKSGQNVKLDDGTLIEAAKYIGPPKRGKKLTLLGDCYDVSDHLVNLAKNSDVLIHEATLEDDFKEKAVDHGHSTPSMAAEVANKINCKLLILNHFSQRYKPLEFDGTEPTTALKQENSNKKDNNEKDGDYNENDDEDDTVQKLIDQAQSQCSFKVIGAFDFYAHKIVD